MTSIERTAVPGSGRDRVYSALVLIGFLAASAGVAWFSSIATAQDVDGWYAEAQTAPWTPPNTVFGPVWTVLYTLMAIAAWLVWRERNRRDVGPALSWYIGQLALNAIWTPLFFALYPALGGVALWSAFVVILLLDVAVLATIVTFWSARRLAGILLIPYLAWLLYATTLNLYAAIAN